jgi:glyoxylase-like metal-dependent hydrolase (beta-lactamase superfamily II)
METLWRNYTAGSALNYYFPALFEETKADPKRLTPAQTLDPPPWVRRVAYTSFAVISESGAALLIDCGHDTVVTTLEQWINEKGITSVEGCWVTHYHDDHVDALHRLPNAFGCPIMADEHLAEIIEHPRRFFLPCIAPSCAPAARKTRDRESWPWHEFQLTAFHFPGQTYYHGGLLVEGRGKKVFFAGDSGAPTGLDDYCGGNRTFLGPGRGFRRCLDIWRECKPDYIFNQHQDRPFRFSDGMLDAMEALLVEREQLVAEMVPWDDPNFAIDEWWVRTHPFEQDVCPEAVFAVDVQFTNHGIHPVEAAIEPVLPGGWRWHKSKGASCARVAARTDGAARAWIRVPRSASQGRYVIPFRVTWAGRYLGQFRHAIVVVC